MENTENNIHEEQDQPIEAQESDMQDMVQDEQMSDVEKCQGELAEMKDKYLRQVADFDNFRKRSAKERNELIQTAGKDVITELLEVLDDMDRAADQMEKSDDLEQIKNGTKLVFSKLRRILESKGLKALETKNADFDTDYHEAITEIPAPSPDMQGKVVDELQKGYSLNDKLIRHAKVVVGK